MNRGAGRAQHPDSEVDQIKCAAIFDDGKGNGRNSKKRCQPKGCSDCIAEIAESDPANRSQSGMTPLGQAACNDIKNTRSGRYCKDEACNGKRGE